MWRNALKYGLGIMPFPLGFLIKDFKKETTLSPYQPITDDIFPINRETTTDYIIVGGGTGGCITAFFLAKWKEENGIPGKVVLLESGDNYINPNSNDTNDPDMWNWYNNWEKFAEVHETASVDGTFDPATGSSHKGLGGCGTHDTRITFIPTDEQSEKMSKLMGWTKDQHDIYIQMALDMIPIETASYGEKFYDAVINKLADDGILNKVDGDEYKAKVLYDTISYVSIAMYPDETRWTSAYLLDESVRPKNLTVLTNWNVDKIIFEKDRFNTYKAVGVTSVDNKFIGFSKCSSHLSEIVITAGSLGTPAILQRSGIGPKKLLEELGIPIIVENEEVGHGVDHVEVPVMYKWLEDNRWNENDGSLPRGGPMAWPLALFFNLDDKVGDESKIKSKIKSKIMAHFGISPPPYGGFEVTATPNCTNPDPTKGFRVFITSTNPRDSIKLVHENTTLDFETLVLGTRKMIDIFEVMKRNGLVGDRVEPPLTLDVSDDEELLEWVKNNLGTAYHWMSTCKAGKDESNTVADPFFRVRGVKNLRVGSGAVLPEIPDANPHLTISAYSIALAHELYMDSVDYHMFDTLDYYRDYVVNKELANSAMTLTKNNGTFCTRNCDTVTPDLKHVAYAHRKMVSGKN